MLRLTLLFICFFAYLFSTPLKVDINARNAILINADNGSILYEKKADEIIYPASITKVFILWYIVENYINLLDKKFEASKNALYVIEPLKKITSKNSFKPYVLETDSVMFDIMPGEKLSLNELLHGMMVISGCDASNVAAEGLEGSIETFMQNLNQYIKNRGILNTHLTNPHGLHMPEHVSTAMDIAKMIKLAIKNPNFLKIFSCKFFIRPKTNKQNKKEIITFNSLMKPGKYYYKNIIGSKTGYHAKAKYNVVSVAKKDDRTLIAVVLGCSDLHVRFEDTIKLFNLAFAEKKQTKILIKKEKLFFSKIKGAAKIIKASLKHDLDIDYYPSEEIDYKACIVYDDIKAPIKTGQKVACIEIKNKDNEILKKENLYAKQNVRRTFFTFLKELFIKS